MVCKIIDCCVKQRYRMGLTVKQNEFVAEIAEGASQTLAYRSAYNTKYVSENHLGGSLAAQEAPEGRCKDN